VVGIQTATNSTNPKTRNNQITEKKRRKNGDQSRQHRDWAAGRGLHGENGQNTAPNGNRGKYIHSNFHSKWARPKWALLWSGPRHEMWAQTHTVDMHTAPMTDSRRQTETELIDK